MSEEARKLSQQLINEDYDRMVNECHRLSEEIMILTNEIHELEAERNGLKDELERFRRG